MITESNYNIEKTEEFENELRAIYDYVAYKLQEIKLAIKLINTITLKIKILENFPYAYKLLKKERNLEYRKFIVKNYVIIYKIKIKCIAILEDS